MCTVTFLPLPACGGFLLATNRDESPARGEALPPEQHERSGVSLLAPIDPDAGGTWVAVDERGRALCVLNGDRPPARAPRPDAPSRGLMLLELMADPRAASVRRVLEERRVRGSLLEKPFKLLVAEPGDAPCVTRIEWDGLRLVEDRAAGPALYVSSTFEPDEVAARRGAAFRDLAARLASLRAPDPASLREAQAAWHSAHAPGAPGGDAFSVCMHRADARSRSLTVVQVTGTAVSMEYRAGSPCRPLGTTTRALARRAAPIAP